MVVFDGDEFTESLRKMDGEYEKAILEIVKKHLKKLVKKTYLKSTLKKERKDTVKLLKQDLGKRSTV